MARGQATLRVVPLCFCAKTAAGISRHERWVSLLRGFEPRHHREEARQRGSGGTGGSRAGSAETMTESDPPDAGGDTCPQCGAEVVAPVPEGTGGAPKGSLPSRPVEIDCPNCGQRLCRAVGGSWRLADEADLDEASSAGNDPAGDGPSDPDSALDEALAESFPASDPPAL